MFEIKAYITLLSRHDAYVTGFLCKIWGLSGEGCGSRRGKTVRLAKANVWPLYFIDTYTICPADNATAGSLGRRRAGQLRFGFVAVSAGHIVYMYIYYYFFFVDLK
jgi:hypothetical protein